MSWALFSRRPPALQLSHIDFLNSLLHEHVRNPRNILIHIFFFLLLKQSGEKSSIFKVSAEIDGIRFFNSCWHCLFLFVVCFFGCFFDFSHPSAAQVFCEVERGT